MCFRQHLCSTVCSRTFPVKDIIWHQFKGQNTHPTPAGRNTVPVTAVPLLNVPAQSNSPDRWRKERSLVFTEFLATLKFFDEFWHKLKGCQRRLWRSLSGDVTYWAFWSHTLSRTSLCSHQGSLGIALTSDFLFLVLIPRQKHLVLLFPHLLVVPVTLSATGACRACAEKPPLGCGSWH